MSVEKGNVIGTHLAQYLLKKEHGRAEYKTVNGHYSVWFYQGWNFNDFEAVIVKPINAN